MTLDPRKITVGPGPRCAWFWRVPTYSSAFDHRTAADAWRAMAKVVGSIEGGHVWQVHGTECDCDPS